MTSNLQTLETAVRHHQAGELDRAERLYEDVLRIDPEHADALHLLGVLAHHRRENNRAVHFISRAISVNGRVPQYHSNLGAAYRTLGDLNRAVECFREAVRINPQFAGGHYNLAMALEALENFDEAETCYREALKQDPLFFEAYNNLGKLLATRKRRNEALECFRKAAELKPATAELRYNLGNALAETGEFDEAIQNFREAIRLSPEIAEFHNNLGTALKAKGEFAEAIACFQKAIELKPGYQEARTNLGATQLACGQSTESCEHFRQALQEDPENLDLRCRLAAVLRSCNRYDEAGKFLREGLKLNPEHADSQFGLGFVLQSEGKHEKAQQCYREAVRINPDHTAAWINLGSILISQDRLNEAEECFLNAIRSNPEDTRAHFNLGNVYKDQWMLDRAVECYQRALQIDPQLAEAHLNLGVVLQSQRRLEEAIACHTKALEIKPDDSEAHFHRSLARLLYGDFQNGWPEYEWRWQYEARPREFPLPVWDGSPLRGRSLLVYAEQGVGDEIMFASCLPELIGRTSACVIECDPRLVPLFARSFPLAQVVPRPLKLDTDYEKSLTSLDLQIAMGSLPRFLRQTPDSFPDTRRYLAPDAKLRGKWRARLDELGDGLKIGVSWRGGNKPEIRRRRSAQLDQWRELFALPGVKFVNLQYGDCAEELHVLREQSGFEIHDWEDADPLSDLDNFAAQIAELDLVISVDNSTVHVAGALGVPVWTLLPFAPNWRWLLNTDRSPWYPTMTLYRQPEPGDWQSVYRQVADDLKSLAERHASQNNNGKTEYQRWMDSERERQKYEKIWTHDIYREKSFGLLDADKVHLVKKLRDHGVKTILDAGCGTGKLMRKFLTEYPGEFDIHGFDISRNCLDPFFDDLRDEILSVGCLWNPDDLKEQYDAVLCTDVMEHIPTEHVPAVLANLKSSTKKLCYLAIALFPDGFGPELVGEPLHLTVKEPQWWYSQIAKAGFRIQDYAVEKHPTGVNLWLHVFADV